MGKLQGIEYYVLTNLGPARIIGWDNDVWFVSTLDGKRSLITSVFLSPVYKTLAEFQLAFPEYFL